MHIDTSQYLVPNLNFYLKSVLLKLSDFGDRNYFGLIELLGIRIEAKLKDKNRLSYIKNYYFQTIAELKWRTNNLLILYI